MQFIFIAIMLFYACTSQNAPQQSPESEVVVIETDSVIPEPIEVDTLAINLQYDSLKQAIETKRKKLASGYATAASDSAKQVLIDEAQHYLLSTLSEDLFPLWYGTIWDFNGITETPLKGEIACGYFVSTTLKHAGFKLQRYKLAQQGATNIVRSLCSDNSINRIGNNDVDKMLESVNQQGKGLYIIGLDYHVGFIFNSGNDIFFVHSNYLDPLSVMSEKAAESEALQMSENYVIGNLLANDSLIEKWFVRGSIPTVTD